MLTVITTPGGNRVQVNVKDHVWNTCDLSANKIRGTFRRDPEDRIFTAYANSLGDRSLVGTSCFDHAFVRDAAIDGVIAEARRWVQEHPTPAPQHLTYSEALANTQSRGKGKP